MSHMTSSLLDVPYVLGIILSLAGPAAHARYSVITGLGLLYMSQVILSVVGSIVHPTSGDMTSIELRVDDD
jgi:hypothetical protein